MCFAVRVHIRVLCACVSLFDCVVPEIGVLGVAPRVPRGNTVASQQVKHMSNEGYKGQNEMKQQQ